MPTTDIDIDDMTEAETDTVLEHLPPPAPVPILTPPKKLNTALLLAIANAIEKYPENYDQSEWINIPEDHLPRAPSLSTLRPTDAERDEYFRAVEKWEKKAYFFDNPKGVPALRTIRKCGSTCCIAGWACSLTPRTDRKQWPKEVLNDIELAAGYELGLSEEHAGMMFSGGFKPPRGLTVPDYLRAVAARDEAFFE